MVLHCDTISHWLSHTQNLGSFCVYTQPMRDDVTLYHHLSLAECVHKMIQEIMIESRGVLFLRQSIFSDVPYLAHDGKIWNAFCEFQLRFMFCFIFKAGTSNYIPHILWDVFTCSCLHTCFGHKSPQIALSNKAEKPPTLQGGFKSTTKISDNRNDSKIWETFCEFKLISIFCFNHFSSVWCHLIPYHNNS